MSVKQAGSNNSLMMRNKESSLPMQLLKNLAACCVYLNAVAMILFLSLSSFADISAKLATICGVLAILISLFPVIYAWQKKKIALLFSGISVLNIAPIWFLYLESILPGYDAYDFIQPGYRVLALFWISVFQFLVNFIYVLFWNGGHIFSI